MIALVRAAIVALYPRTDALPGADECDLDAFLHRFRRETTLLLWTGVVVGALVFELSPVFTVRVPLPASFLPRVLADRHADRIAGSRFYLVRQSVFLVKLAAGLCWGVHPRVRASIGLPPLPPDPGSWRTD